MNQIVTKAVEELSSEMVAFEEMTPPEEKALKRPQIITAIFTQKLTEVYMAGRSDAAEYIDSLATTEDLPFGVYRGVVRQPHKWPELIEQAKQPVKITTDCMTKDTIDNDVVEGFFIDKPGKLYQIHGSNIWEVAFYIQNTKKSLPTNPIRV